MSTQEMTSTNNVQAFSVSDRKGQYTLWQVLGIWLAAGAPMGLLGWVAYPVMSAGLPPLDAGLLRIKLFTVGLIWQFVLAMLILYREEGDIRLSTIRRRFWLNHPVSARTGATKKALWWWIIPLFLLSAFVNIVLRSPLIDTMGKDRSFLSRTKGLRYVRTVYARTARTDGWRLGLAWLVLRVRAIQQCLGRGILLPRRAIAEDARHIW
jgi:CAAX protease family protein